MRKLSFEAGLSIAICIGIIVGFSGLAIYALWRVSTEDPVARNPNAPEVPYNVCVAAGSVGGDDALIAIDLSDTTNYPHARTSEVVMRGIFSQGSLDATNHWDVYWGVVLENDATDGSVMWLQRQHRDRIANFDIQRLYGSNGLNLRVTDGALVYATSNISLTSSAIFSSGAVITSSVGTSSPGVGDVVVWMDEVDDGAILEYAVCFDYDTQ